MRKSETQTGVSESKTETRIVPDQAEELRKLAQSQKVLKMEGITRVISFTSGKGGVGKTNTVVNIAAALTEQGRSVLVLDADLGLANVDVLLNISVAKTIQDVLEGRCSMEEVIIDTPQGFSVIPAASGVEHICDLAVEQRLSLIESIEAVAAKYDYLLIDTRAGIGTDVMYFNSASSEIVCIVNGEPTSLTDSYALIKVLSRNYGEKSISIVANNVPGEIEAERAFNRLEGAVNRFLQVDLKYLGYIPSDGAVSSAVAEQRALIQEYPSSKAAQSVRTLAKRIDLEFYDHRVKGGMQFFFKQLLEVSAGGIGI